MKSFKDDKRELFVDPTDLKKDQASKKRALKKKTDVGRETRCSF